MANSPAPALVLRDGDRDELMSWTRSTAILAGLAMRARIVLPCAWNSTKLILNGPVSVALLFRARVREAVPRRRARRSEYHQPHEYAEVHP